MFVISFLIYQWNFLFMSLALDFIFLYHPLHSFGIRIVLASIKFCTYIFLDFWKKIVEISLADLTFYHQGVSVSFSTTLISDLFANFGNLFFKKWSSSLDFFVCFSFVPQCSLFIMYLFSVLLAELFYWAFQGTSFSFF